MMADGWRVHVAAAAFAVVMSVHAQSGPSPVGDLKSLGNDRYQAGQIVIDKAARKFTVPGRIILANAPLEYLAGAPGGVKNYETLLELTTTSIEFKLACILIGLEPPSYQAPHEQLSHSRLPGQRVALRLEWQDGDKRRAMPAAEAVLSPNVAAKAGSVEWVYTGRVMAEATQGYTDRGTLIGFVHDPNTIIESVETIGVGAYGSIRGNPALPPVGTPIELVVEVVRPAK